MSSSETTPSADAPAPKGGVPMMILALVGGLAVGGAGGAFAVGPMVAERIAPAAAHAASARKAAGHAEDAGEEGEAGASGEEHAEGTAAAKPVHMIDNLVLNPAESGGQRFLLLSIAFELKDAAALEELKARDAELRDAVLQSMGGKTVDFLGDMAMRDSLKSELKSVAGKLFPKAKQSAVRRVYFPQFVIQ